MSSPEESSRRGLRGLRGRARGHEWLWFVVPVAVVSLVTRTWELPVIVLAVFAVVFAVQAWTRRRARSAHAAAAAAGGGEWAGRLSTDTADWLWPRGLSMALGLMYGDGLPVRLRADSAGITVAPYGPLVSRLRRLSPVLIPWSDIAGARERDRGYSTASGKLSTVTLHDVTIDVVGPSATEWDFADDWLDDADEDVTDGYEAAPDDPPHDDDEPFDAAEHAAFLVEHYGPDWRPGTAPLVVTTAATDGLVEHVTRWATGRPHVVADA
jgi:hypothetical protein